MFQSKIDNIEIRTVNKADLAIIAKWQGCCKHKKLFYPKFLRSEVNIQNEYDKNGFLTQFAGLLVIEYNGNAVGLASFAKIHPVYDYMEIGMSIEQEDLLGRGIASNALQLLLKYLFFNYKINRIVGTIVEGNNRAVEFVKRNGFKYDGTIKEVCWHEGKYSDIFLYSISRVEFLG